MAQVDTVSFGAELKDGYKPVDGWVSNGVVWLEDIEQFYRERSTIEREYSQKLSALAAKYHEKKSKKSSSLSVGDTPALTPGSLEAASITTWTTQLNTLESRAAEHDKLSKDLISQVATPLNYTQKRFEELRKSHADYNTKLVKERDGTYADLKKLKTKYDTACQDLENKRKKQDSAFDHGRSKAANAYNQQLMEMHNVKNSYLVAINVTNKLKECYYHEYVPDLVDSLQDLNETRVVKLNSIWSVASAVETATLSRSVDLMKNLSNEIPRNNPGLDSMMFLRHNAVQWQDPPDFGFEPSPVWLDNDTIETDETAKVFLRNIITNSKPIMKDAKLQSEQKRKELENVKRARQNIRAGRDKRDEVDCVRSQFAVQEELHAIDRQRITAEVEVSTVTAVVGDLSMYGKNHQFKSETFKIPTNCDRCGDRIWGLSAKGFICTDCGFTCHSKCQMKVSPECPGEQTKEEKKRLKVERQAAASVAAEAPPSPSANGHERSPPLSRQDTMSSLSSGYAVSAGRSVSNAPRPTSQMENGPASPLASSTSISAPATAAARRNRVVAPPPVAYIGATDGASSGGAQNKGRMMYPYEARDAGEISVDEGKEVTIIEPDDGGWTKIRIGFGKEGVVPTAYIEEVSSTLAVRPTHERTVSTYSNSSHASHTSQASGAPALKKKGPAVAPRRGAKKVRQVQALYAYAAQSDAEFDMREGEKFVLVSMGTGDGWAEVEKNGESRSVPANYIEEI